MGDPRETPIIVAGMHRSGTSLLASILQAGGVHMGERLTGGLPGNVRGHFENIDFVEFHRENLVRQRLPEAGWIAEGFPEIAADQMDRARKLIETSAAHCGPAGGGWGWKDPRTTLFLPFWKKMLPEARYILIYRSPWEVADSIFRRAAEIDLYFRRNPIHVIHVWRHYNALMLAFMEGRGGERCVLIASDALLGDPTGCIRTINERLGTQIGPPPKDIVAADLMKRDISATTRPHLVALACPEALEMLERLQAAAAIPSPKLGGEELTRIRESSDLSDSFRDWFDRYQLYHLVSRGVPPPPGQQGPQKSHGVPE